MFPDLSAAAETRQAEIEIGAVGALDSKARNVFLTVIAVVFLVQLGNARSHLAPNFGWNFGRHLEIFIAYNYHGDPAGGQTSGDPDKVPDFLLRILTRMIERKTMCDILIVQLTAFILKTNIS